VAALAPAALVVAGLGDPRWVAPLECLRQPALAIDHLPLKRTEPPPPPELAERPHEFPLWLGISGAGWTPQPSTSIIAYWLTQALADTRQQSWLASVGTLAALGERTDHPLVVAARKAHGASWLREIVVLLRAVEQCAHPPVEAAVGLLLAAREPKEVVVSTRPERAALAAARAEVEAAIEGLRWVEPVAHEPLTLVQVDSPCAVQGVLAAIWANRRPERPVLVGNRGRRPGWVAFALLEPPGDDGPMSRRHWPISTLFDRAEGEDRTIRGQVPATDWPAVLDCLGVTAEDGRFTWAMPKGET
jgi:single-stranded-DNA-specific exonuclease